MKITKSQLKQIIKEELSIVLSESCRDRSDGCTNWPDRDYFSFGGTQAADWSECCVDHDCCYEKGGTEQDRLNCDRKLRNCANQAGGPGDLMYSGTREWGSTNFNYQIGLETEESGYGELARAEE